MVRFVAALGVVWYHYGLPKLTNDQTPLYNFAASGYAGVLLFFILSGFILVYVSSDRDLSSSPERASFWWRRFARIYPVYFFAWTLYGVFIVSDTISKGRPLGQTLKWSAFFGGTNLALVQAWIPAAVAGWNRPGWSLSVEALFYALFPLIFLCTRQLSVRALFALLISSWAVGAAIMTALEWTSHPLLAGTFLQTTWKEYLQNFPLLQLPLFVAGVALGRLYVRGVRFRYPAFLLVGCVALLLLTLALPKLIFSVPRDVLLPPVFGALLYLLALVKIPSSGLWASPALLLGKASYALYILQAPVWGLYLLAIGRAWSDPRSWSEVLTFCTVLIVASVATHVLVERPAERWINSLRLVRQSRLVAAAATVSH
jgi:peptidoglycan/LPS O-acetylase OafA/YrhL